MSTERRRRRSRQPAVTEPSGPVQPPWRLHERRFDPTPIVSDDELEAIHTASLTVLRDTGMDFLHPTARQKWAAAGAKVDGDRVRFDPEMVTELVAAAPGEFVLHAPDPARHLPMGGRNVAFASVASPPNAADRAGGRRTGNREDFRRLVMLAEVLNAVGFHGGYPVEPVDVHASVRHLVATRDLLTLTGKALHAYSLGAQRNRDCLEMVRIARGVTGDDLEAQPSIFTVVNCSSPLRLDTPMLEGILQYSARNQVVVVTPFTLAGAMAPVTVAGAVVQQNAEALAGIAFCQLVRAGSPVMYGGFTSNVDMQYAVDAQAAYESVFSLWAVVTGGAHMVMHGAGWMEGGLQACYEKMVIDADMIGMVGAFLEPLATDTDSLAVEAIDEVGPGGHFFGTAHTLARYRDAFFKPMVSDWRNYETWAEAGSPTALDHAERLVGELLAVYEPPRLAADVRAELDDFTDRRIAEGGVDTDF